MLKRKSLMILVCVLLCGCGSSTAVQNSALPLASPSPSTAVSAVSSASADVSSYLKEASSIKESDSWTASVTSTYTMHYEDNSDVIYSLEGTFAAEDTANNPIAHLHLNIDSDGMPAEMDSYYYEGRLYSVYNQVQFYEDQGFDSVKKTMMVPMDLISVSEDEIASVSVSETENGTEWTIQLNQSGADHIFQDSYDFYELSSYDDYQVSSGELKQVFDNDNHLVGQSSSFQASVSYQGSSVKVDAVTSVSFSSVGSTVVMISDALKQQQKAYVNYQEIDTSAISSVDPSEDDEGENAVETFKNRLVYRLGYKLQTDGTYLAEFNEHESYRVDFTNNQFTYTNYTSSYVYNWKGDEGGFGSTCNYNFSNERATDNCNEDVIEQIRNTKNFLLMELYYCGLSLEDLQQAS